MSKHFNIPAEIRTDAGKGASRRLRRAGRVPAVVYGGEREPATISVDHDSVLHMAENESFFASIIELTVADGRKQDVVVRDLQRHPFKPRLTHIDFMRVQANVALRISVPLHFLNQDSSPAGKTAGVVISHPLTEVEIEALPGNLPEYLEVDLAKLEPGDTVFLSQVSLPEGVRIPALEVEDAQDPQIVSAVFVRESQGTGEMAAESDAAAEEPAEVATVAESEADAEDDAAKGE